MMFLAAYADFKNLIGASLSLSQGALHVHLGIALFLAGAWAIRTETRFTHSLWALLAICLVNESLDLSNSYRSGDGLDWRDSVLDVAHTVFWPSLWVIFDQLRHRKAPAGSG